MKEPLIGNTLHHETDLVGVCNHKESGPRATHAGQDVVDPCTPNVLRKLAPATLDPILNRVLVSGWPGQLGQLFHQLEHELDLLGNTRRARNIASIRRLPLISNRGLRAGVRTSRVKARRCWSRNAKTALNASCANERPRLAKFKNQHKCG